MSATSPEPLALLRGAAELRAVGTPWADAARQLSVEHAELRRLVAEHDRDYERLARKARTEFRDEMLCAALASLRSQLNSADERIRFMASTTIVRYELARMRHGTRAAAEELERGTRRSSRQARTVTVDARPTRDANASESPKVPIPKDVSAAQKVAQPTAPPTTPPPAQAARAPQAPAAPANKSPLSEAERRKQRLLMQAALRPGTSAPITRGGGSTQDAGGAVQSWLGG